MCNVYVIFDLLEVVELWNKIIILIILNKSEITLFTSIGGGRTGQVGVKEDYGGTTPMVFMALGDEFDGFIQVYYIKNYC